MTFEAGGDLNPGGSFDACWQLSGNLIRTAVAATDENLTHFDAEFTAHGVLFGDDVDVVDARLATDTDSGETTPTFKATTSSGTLGFFVFIDTQLFGLPTSRSRYPITVSIVSPTSGNTSTWTIGLTATTTVRSVDGSLITETASATSVAVTITRLPPGAYISQVSSSRNGIAHFDPTVGALNAGNIPGPIIVSGFVSGATGTLTACSTAIRLKLCFSPPLQKTRATQLPRSPGRTPAPTSGSRTRGGRRSSSRAGREKP